MFDGASMASPQAAGAVALLLSAASQSGVKASPAALRTALTSSAGFLDDQPAYAQGAGLISVPAAWKLLRKNAEPTTYAVKAPVCGGSPVSWPPRSPAPVSTTAVHRARAGRRRTAPGPTRWSSPAPVPAVVRPSCRGWATTGRSAPRAR
ncbi:S8 family serine peptidase [Streptomyces sp. SM10]|uniref:S8 family serine peptidase n=1 Tax=Streptomyces sp. SM10 TaxID=565556 RepID=UPI000CDB7572|nr:S8 family serine peptidase [Streptomyces sp. SM10]